MLISPPTTPPPVPRQFDGTARIAVQDVGRRTVVRVAGEIDIATAPALRRAIEAALSDGTLDLWIDLTATSFMDASGVHALIAAQARTRELNRRLAIVCPGGPVRRLFDVAGVGGQLPILDDRAAAHLQS